MRLAIAILLMASAVIAKQVCVPRTAFNEYCNTCTCSDNGLSYGCTEKMCDEKHWNRDGSKKDSSTNNDKLTDTIKKVCEPQSQFKNYCNTCACGSDGSSYICTRMMCDKSIWNKDGSLKKNPDSRKRKRSTKQVCEPKSRFNDYCNMCACSDDGMSFGCTRMMCQHDMWYKNGTLKAVPTSHKGKRSVCQPRTQFFDYCNICSCSDDGLTYSCTRMMCDKKIWNKDGSRKPYPAVQALDK